MFIEANKWAEIFLGQLPANRFPEHEGAEGLHVKDVEIHGWEHSCQSREVHPVS